ncbi:MAG: DUF2946 family protein [Corticimicrobacter sp.]|uniref:DUF2946 family protein n=1 Tax=Corticimicrobacter sp. TaxID=2678536 RepID=UPI0032D9D98B
MLRIRFNLYRQFASRLLLWPLLFVLALRALVPIGYMPGQGVQEHGFGFDLCVGSDRSSQEILASWRDQSADAEDSGVAGSAPCVFCLLTFLSADLPPAGVVASVPFFFLIADLLPVGTVVARLPQAVGSPLGPRAPPVLL